MTNEADRWLNLMVRPAVPGAQPSRLDDHIMQMVPAAVSQHFENGKWRYKHNEQGEYEVRLHVPSLRGFLEQIIKHNAFEVSRVIQMPEGIEIK